MQNPSLGNFKSFARLTELKINMKQFSLLIRTGFFAQPNKNNEGRSKTTLPWDFKPF